MDEYGAVFIIWWKAMPFSRVGSVTSMSAVFVPLAVLSCVTRSLIQGAEMLPVKPDAGMPTAVAFCLSSAA